ncbi:hypothetical protein AVEN_20532-1 [Araneus ventricosus]|uniref:Uncharacterized protein n=1 Tax=Araneus ventricosus TaxID=182803 RepID=A0A4Y2WC23_ARAVE|nr:hypothetical protein AVEN_20532-1 [Araneus ventricosus]
MPAFFWFQLLQLSGSHPQRLGSLCWLDSVVREPPLQLGSTAQDHCRTLTDNPWSVVVVPLFRWLGLLHLLTLTKLLWIELLGLLEEVYEALSHEFLQKFPHGWEEGAREIDLGVILILPFFIEEKDDSHFKRCWQDSEA